MRKIQLPPGMTEAEYFAPWRRAGQRPFNPAIDGFDAWAAFVLAMACGLVGAALVAIYIALA